jgi:hypothetical protein
MNAPQSTDLRLKHRLIGNTLKADEDGVYAKCICGWVSRPCFSSLIASNEFCDHQEEAMTALEKAP